MALSRVSEVSNATLADRLKLYKGPFGKQADDLPDVRPLLYRPHAA